MDALSIVRTGEPPRGCADWSGVASRHRIELLGVPALDQAAFANSMQSAFNL